MDYIVPVIVTLAVLLACYFFLRGSSADYLIVDTIKDGKDNNVYQRPLPKSINRPEGIEFSYTGWLRIDDFTYRYGVPKVIFVKGSADLSTACPALVIDGNTNSLLVKIDTFGAQETIPVVSVPANKWLHVAINVNQEAVDVYINGILYAHHILSQLPRQNMGTVLNSPDGGFAGRIVRLEYHPQVLTASDILSRAAEKPPVGDEKDQAFPPYFDFSWFNK
jgi:Concanavalin A-like lectin/glucanases superfamily